MPAIGTRRDQEDGTRSTKIIMKKLTHYPRSLRLGVLFALLTGLFVAGCNTTEGFGEDVESAGEKISDEARKAN
jgi:predicted small secreted protein